jgi:hypothetical protein
MGQRKTVHWTLPHGRVVAVVGCCAIFPGSLPTCGLIGAQAVPAIGHRPTRIEDDGILFCVFVLTMVGPSTGFRLVSHRRFSSWSFRPFRLGKRAFPPQLFSRSPFLAHRDRVLFHQHCFHHVFAAWHLSYLSISRRTPYLVAVYAPCRNAAATNHIATPCK